MPLYEYRCKSCGYQFEKIQSFSAPEEKECPQCHAEVERLLSAPAIQFKGSGWYVSDYAKKGGTSMKASADGAKSDGTSTEKPTGATESKNTTPSSSAPSTGKSE